LEQQPISKDAAVVLQLSGHSPDFFDSQYEALAQEKIKELMMTQTLVQFYDEQD
jgi:hypothetical protein